jgi:hypothetical protein
MFEEKVLQEGGKKERREEVIINLILSFKR